MDVVASVNLKVATAKRSLFLFGPRQTGKSTLIRNQLPAICLVDEPELDLTAYVGTYLREEVALLGWDVPAWQSTKKRKTVSTAKFWIFNWGVVRRLCNTGRAVSPSPECGRAIEAWIGRETSPTRRRERSVALA